jgi:hypothetical protein
MAKDTDAGRSGKGRGTKPERKAARRAAAKDTGEPKHPSRTDRALPGAAKQRSGPRR